jgi:hypothetical protein
MSVTEQAGPGAAAGEGGRVARWIRSDPVRATAVALIAVQIAWRPQIAARGFLAFDDFTLASRSAESHLTVDYLTTLFNNHFMPAGLLITWLVTHAVGLAYWPYVMLMTLGQAAVSIAFYRLLRELLRPGWGQLVPLAVFLFSPLTLEVTSWWAVGVNLLPMQLAMVLAIDAQVRYARTRRPRHLVTLGLALLLGLLFFEKSVLIAPLVFLLTACLFTSGGPVRSLLRALVRYWQSWAVLLGIWVAYLALYLTRAQSSLHRPASAGEAFDFVRQLILFTLIPGLFGGPWRWLAAGDGAPVTAPAEVPRWLALGAFVALVVLTVLARRIATRAWVLLLGYVALVAVLLAMTRLGFFFSAAAGLAPRYVSDVVVVAALCIGVAVLGLRDPVPVTATPEATMPDATTPEAAAPAADPDAAPVAGSPAVLRSREGIAGVLVVVLAAYLLGAAWSAARFGDDWAVKRGRDYLRTAEQELATVPPGTVFLDQAVPESVQSSLAWPYNLQSHFFRPAQHRPVFVTEAEDPSIFDDLGHIRHAVVQGHNILPGTDPTCGYKIDSGGTAHMRLAGNLIEWLWVVRVGYLSSGDSDALLHLGDGSRWFHVHKGLHQVIMLVEGVGDTIELTVQDPAVTLCTNEITVGRAVPRP